MNSHYELIGIDRFKVKQIACYFTSFSFLSREIIPSTHFIYQLANYLLFLRITKSLDICDLL